MKVIVGLGNPGNEYDRTRHNIGWLALDALAEKISAGRFRQERSVAAAEATFAGEKLYLLKPQTYMNRSGQALAAWLGWMGEIREAIQDKTPPAEAVSPADNSAKPSRQDKADDLECKWPGLLVLSDDVNLPVGKLRFRPTGSAGGHNGLADIERALGGRGYPRLRLGVGAVPERMDMADYVLSRFTPEEMPVLRKVVDLAAEAATDWLKYGMNAARGKYNGLVVGGGEAV